jgi:O-antigen ligase
MIPFTASRDRAPTLAGHGLQVIGISVAAGALGLIVIRLLTPGPAPPAAFTIVVGLAAVGVLALALARYETAAALGMLLFGVVFIEPSPPDAVLGIVMLVALITGRFSVSAVPLPMFVLVLALLALTAISAIFAILPGRAVFFFAITAYLAVFALWLTGYVNSVERARSVIRPLVAGAVVSSLVGVAVLFASFPGRALVDFREGDRAAGLFKDPNVFGPFLVVVALIVLAEILEPRLLTGRLLTKLGILLSLSLGIVFAYSRAAWLNAAVGVLVMLFVYALRRQGGVKVAKIVVALAVAFAVVSVTLAATGSADFLQERAQLQSYDVERFAGQRAGIDLAQQYPLGIGPGQFEQTVGIASHSLYVRLLAEQGILGMVVLGALLFGTLGFAATNAARGRDSYGVSSAALLGAWCGVVVNSAFVDTLHWRHFWLVAALIWVGAMRQGATSRPVPWDARPAGAR